MRLRTDIAAEEDGSHPPADNDDPNYQESFSFLWHDPKSRAGGYQHVDLQYGKGRACLASWIALDSAIVAHEQSFDLALPGMDLSELELGPLQIRTKEPLRALVLTVDHGRAGRIEIEYQAVSDPVDFDFTGEGATISTGHHEAIGRISGSLVTQGRSVPLGGMAYRGHSWGPREYGSLLTDRWVCAMFGDDLCCSVMTVGSDLGRRDMGWIYDRGAMHPITEVSFGMQIADDGHTPTAADVRFFRPDGFGYHLTAVADVANIETHEQGFFATNALARFELGGRLGAGILTAKELPHPTLAQRRFLGMEQ